MKFDGGQGFAANGGIELGYKGGAMKRELVFQRRGGDVDVEGRAVDMAFVGVAVHSGANDFGPHIACSLRGQGFGGSGAGHAFVENLGK